MQPMSCFSPYFSLINQEFHTPETKQLCKWASSLEKKQKMTNGITFWHRFRVCKYRDLSVQTI